MKTTARYALPGLVCSLALLASCGGGGASTPSTPSGGGPTPTATPLYPAIMAAGDISCDSATPQLPCKSKETSDLILAERRLRDVVVALPLGDLQYESGTLAEFNKNYHATWGRVNPFAHPAPGNHEYETRNAQGYFDYFATQGVAVGARNEGFYSYDVGDWHFISLNSNCGRIGGCNVGSAQYRWLNLDLLENQRKKCTVAYMHHPFISSGQNGNNPDVVPLMSLLYDNNVDIVLAGHDHSYERFNPMTPQQVADFTKGFRLFVSGAGGRDLYPFPRVLPNSAVRVNSNFGVLRIVMQPTSYDWQYVLINGTIADTGTASCI